MQETSASLIAFGAGVFKQAKVINQLDLLKHLTNGLDSGRIHPIDPSVIEFGFEQLIDSIKIIIFFENYMKAELIARGFCIHLINKDVAGFTHLVKEQFKRPVLVREMHDILPFEVDETAKTIFHDALKENTLSFKVLVGLNYVKYYRFDQGILDFIIDLNKKRNHLHLYKDISFELSQELISKIEIVNDFVDQVVQMIQPKSIQQY
jgi:hypothetical protein